MSLTRYWHPSFNISVNSAALCQCRGKDSGLSESVTEMVESDLIIGLYEKYLEKKLETNGKIKENGATVQLGKKEQKNELLWAAVSNSTRSKQSIKTKASPRVYKSVQQNCSNKRA